MFTALMVCCASRQREENAFQVAELLLRARANVNAQDRVKMTPFLYAAKHSHLSLLPLLVAHGAAVNKQELRGWSVSFGSVLLAAVTHLCCVGSLFRRSEWTHFCHQDTSGMWRGSESRDERGRSGSRHSGQRRTLRGVTTHSVFSRQERALSC